MQRWMAAGLGVLLMAPLLVLAAPEPGRLELVYADSARGYSENGRLVRELIGRVEFRQDSSQMFCDRAIQYPEEELVLFTGNVRILTPPRELMADEILHFEVRREQIARGHARFRDRRQRLTADTLRYFEKEERALAQGRATISDSLERARLSGRQIEYLRLKGYARVEGEPLFVRQDSTGRDSLVVRSRLMELFDDGQRVAAREEVTMQQGLFSASCGEMVFMRQEEKITLMLQPQARHGDDRLNGTEIDLFMQGRTLTGIGIRGSAAVVSRVDTLASPAPQYDLITGEAVHVGVKGKSVDSVHVKGRATSYYHLYDEKKYQGINKVLGDELIMRFAEGRVQYVSVLSKPAVSNGIFFPPGGQATLVQELELLLQPFQLRPERVE